MNLSYADLIYSRLKLAQQVVNMMFVLTGKLMDQDPEQKEAVERIHSLANSLKSTAEIIMNETDPSRLKETMDRFNGLHAGDQM